MNFNQHRNLLVLIRTSVFLIISFIVFAGTSVAEPLVVVVNKSNPTENLTATEVKRIFQGRETRWIDGQKILVINQSIGTTARQDFFRIVLDIAPDAPVVSPGYPEPFKSFELLDSNSVLNFVSRFPNTIGYVPASHLTDSVKHLRVSGFSHSEAGYPIK